MEKIQKNGKINMRNDKKSNNYKSMKNRRTTVRVTP